MCLRDTPDSHARRWLLACCIGIVTVYAVFFLVSAFLMGPADQDQFLVFHELQYWNSKLFGLAKQWTPVMCAGLSMAGEPQIPFLSLSMILGYALDPFWGIKIAAVLYFAIGWVGAHLYAGLWLKDLLQRRLAAALFIGNGFFFCRLGAGHADFMPFLDLPLILWLLHQTIEWRAKITDAGGFLRLVAAVLGLAALLSLGVDGSPVTIIHLVFWVALYALVLAFSTGALTPLLVLGSALAATSVLDAGYLWPMLDAQSDFPRLTSDRFTSALTLLWFAVIPMRGKLLPANGLGYELSVYIGPLLAWAIWRHRQWCRTHIPAEMKAPLLVASIGSIVMGMGSLAVVHVPYWLSPFDLLRPLPGFRSIWITGRYWGFLALPLSLLGAASLWRVATAAPSRGRLALWIGAVLFLQLGFQAQTIFSQWRTTAPYKPINWQHRFEHRPETVRYVSISRHGVQGQFITPVQGVVNCYDKDDFQHAEVSTGEQLVRATLADGRTTSPAAHAAFGSWNDILLRTDPAGLVRTGSAPNRVEWVLDQAYHKHWRMPGCKVERAARGNLVADCPAKFEQQPPTLSFFDPLSAYAARVSVVAWSIWIGLVSATVLAYWVLRYPPRPPESVRVFRT